MKSQFEVVVAGHAAVDEVIDSRNQSEPRVALGGALCYSSICLASLGFSPIAVTKIGDDFPNEYLKLLKELADIDLTSRKSKLTATTRFRITREGDKRELYLLRRCDDIGFEDLENYLSPNSTKKLRPVIINAIAGEISPEVVRRIAETGVQVFVDSQSFTREFDKKTGRVNLKTGIELNFLSGVFALKADLKELRALTGFESKQEAIESLSKFVEYIIVTSGGDDTELYAEGDQKYSARPFHVRCLDTTGAGDILLSAFAARFIESGDPNLSLEFATAASSLATEALGIRKSVLSRKTIEDSVDSAKNPDTTRRRASSYQQG